MGLLSSTPGRLEGSLNINEYSPTHSNSINSAIQYWNTFQVFMSKRETMRSKNDYIKKKPCVKTKPDKAQNMFLSFGHKKKQPPFVSFEFKLTCK